MVVRVWVSPWRPQVRRHRFNAWAVRAYFWHSSTFFRWLVTLVVYLHVFLVVFEPVSTESGHEEGASERQALYAEAAFVAVYVIDAALLAFHTGTRDLVRSWGKLVYLLLVATIVVDVAGSLAAWDVVRFSRPLRAVLLVYDR